MLDALLTFVNDYAPELSAKKTLLAVSGGVDSMVMAELFSRAGFSFALAHCNFGLRGAESDGDEVLVQHWAEKKGINFYRKSFATAQKAETEGISIQMAARDLRYAWFEELAREFKYDYLATAHHADDNIETVLLNITRGTGLPGLLGIAPVKGQLVRPLLFNSKEEILCFAQKEKLAWREDSSNASDAYRRNLLRHKVLPVLWEINPSLHRTFNQNLEQLRAVDSLVGSQLLEWRKEAVRSEGDATYIYIPMLRKGDEASCLLYEVLREYGFNYTQTKQIVASLDGISGKQFSSASHILTKDRGNLVIESLRPTVDFPPIIIHKNTQWVALPGDFSLIIERRSLSPNLDFRTNPRTAYFDAARLHFPLIVRPWQAGDRLQPFGMSGKSKKVSDLLVEAKVPLNRKKGCLVLLDDEQKMLWVLGLRTGELYKVNAETIEIFQMRIVAN